MLSFLKTKRGFTLVELMIVVVIMAILVAVAVPIYATVSGNAKKRTCIDNQRQIMSSLSNYIMTKEVKIETASEVYITTGVDNSGTVTDNGGIIDADLIKILFSTLPICPIENNVIVISVNPNGSDDELGADVSVKCTSDGSTATDHTV